MRLRENCEPLSKNKNDRNKVKNNAKSIGRREYITNYANHYPKYNIFVSVR